MKGEVLEWFNRSPNLIEQDHKDLLALLEQEALREKLDASRRRCQTLNGPAPIGWSSGFSCEGYTADLSERDKQLAYLKKVQEEDKERVARDRVERELVTWDERREAFNTILEKERLNQRSSALDLAWLREIERSKKYHAEERQRVTKPKAA